MSVKINYTNKKISKLSSNLVLFSNEKFELKKLKKNFSNSELSYISDLLKANDLKKKILLFEVNSKKENFFNIYKK